MIRFLPDTLREALWRPVAMAAADAHVYVEIMAPDLRFAVLLVLTLAAALVAWLRRERFGTLGLLVIFIWLSFLPWLATTGNGRYFIALLLLVGPLCIALIQRMPASRTFRWALCVMLVVSQAWVIVNSDPRRAWALMSWGTPYVDLALTPAEREEPATWVMMTSLSHSLVAPQFDPRSRWINIAALSGDLEHSLDDQRGQSFLARAVSDGLPLRLLLPTDPGFAEPSGAPSDLLLAEIDRLLSHHRLGLAGKCEIRLSRTLATRWAPYQASIPPLLLERSGFWICPLSYPVAQPPVVKPTAQELEASRVFAVLERLCPRFFPASEGRNARLPDGFQRTYSITDMKAFVMDDGEVRFKYWRALNPNRVGTREEVLAPGFAMECHVVYGRSGLPWERRR